MARATKMAERPPIKRKITATTNINPERMLFSRSATIRRTSLLMSLVRSILRLGGNRGFISLTMALTWSVTSTMFSPLRF